LKLQTPFNKKSKKGKGKYKEEYRALGLRLVGMKTRETGEGSSDPNFIKVALDQQSVGKREKVSLDSMRSCEVTANEGIRPRGKLKGGRKGQSQVSWGEKRMHEEGKDITRTRATREFSWF